MKSRSQLPAIVVGVIVVAAIGGTAAYWRDPSANNTAGDRVASAPARAVSEGEALVRLEDYTRSIVTREATPAPAANKLLPDVSTMIERLAARLETVPDDPKGWRMLGWSYFHTGAYAKAAAAYEKAVRLDPGSDELKRSHEEAKAKAAGPHAESKPEATPPRDSDAEIRDMVDGLADRLEKSPRDVDGWTRLLRSRVVLGETEVAATALRKALEVFRDDAVASGRVAAAARELGLKVE